MVAMLISGHAPPAGAGEVVWTVESLLTGGFSVVGSFLTRIGPAIFLQREHVLFLCFATEQPDGREITTNYCKPVR
jgi:hypothetical protein